MGNSKSVYLLINMLWHGLDSEESIPIDYRIYDKDTDGKTKNTHFSDMLKLAIFKYLHSTDGKELIDTPQESE